ncbi:DUF664 domain-containing protein [Kocuria palustris]|uniref:mycothiol transferase n=1 Tax=Kocuria palustris TaxID=71999 RepID=UPI0028CFEFF7|nr:DUF664 domain-containing protein [Kocuria palustris]
MGFLPPSAVGEHDVLRTYALQQLAQMRTAVHGLSDEQAHAAPTASVLNLTGLLLHTSAVGVYWSALAAAAPGAPVLPEDLSEDPSLDSLIADARPLSEVLEQFDRHVALTAQNLDEAAELDALVPVPPSPWIPEDVTHWEVRWCLAHIAAEVARHAGHADLLRETLDGRGSFELNDAADGES